MGRLFYLHSSFAHHDLPLYCLASALVVFDGLQKSVHSLPRRRTSLQLRSWQQICKKSRELEIVLGLEESVTKLVHCFSPPTGL